MPALTSGARALAIVAALAGGARAAPDDDGAGKRSLAIEPDRVAWTRPGFRLGLGVAYGRAVGLHGAPSGRLLAAVLRVGLRLDREWSVQASFQYAQARRAGGLSGLRFAGTIDPTWHVTPSFSLAAGLGFAGFVEGRATGRAEVDPTPGSLDSSYTFPSASPALPSCSGVGLAGLARAEYLRVLGPRTATSLSLELFGQYTACVDATNRVEPDTAQPIVRRQYWPHVGAIASWGFTWR